MYKARNKGDVMSLVPLADLMNHANTDSPLGFDTFKNGTVSSLNHVADSDYDEGSEVFASYDSTRNPLW